MCSAVPWFYGVKIGRQWKHITSQIELYTNPQRKASVTPMKITQIPSIFLEEKCRIYT